MIFEVTFTTGDPNKNVLNNMGTAGIDFLDMFREDYPQYKELGHEDIKYYDSCPVNGHSINTEISEEIARESGLFKGKTSVYVTIGDFMNKYVDLNVTEEIRTTYKHRKLLWFPLPSIEEKYLSYVVVRNSFNFEEMLNDWRLAGFPLEWNV